MAISVKRALLCSLTMLSLLPMGVRADDYNPGAWYTNWLAGLSIGYAGRVGCLTVRNTYQAERDRRQILEQIPGAYIRRDLSDSGTIWGAFIGYQGIYQKWLKGIELSVDHHGISTSKGFAFSDPNMVFGYNGLMRYQRKWIGGLTLRVGYALTDRFMPYLRGGAELASDRLTTSFNSPALLDSMVVTNEERQWVYRFLLGAGIETPLYPSCGTTLRLEYDFHSKGKTLKTESALREGFFNPIFQAQAQPYTQSVRLSVVWNFF